MVTSSLVMHDIGDARGGAPWKTAFADQGFDAQAPDLPGHADAAGVTGGYYQLDDVAVVVARCFVGRPNVDILVGVGASGWPVQMAALAGRCDRLVLVDALGGPFIDVPERMQDRRTRIRAAVAAGAATPDAGRVTGEMDPRVLLVPPGHQDRPFAIEAAAALTLPTLVIETTASSTGPSDAIEIARLMSSEVVRLPAPDPKLVAATVAEWQG